MGGGWFGPVIQLFSGFGQDFSNGHAFVIYCLSQARNLLQLSANARRVGFVGGCVAVCLFYLAVACSLSNSLTLTAFSHLLIFDLMSLGVALISMWAKRQSPTINAYTLGYERFEVVAVFAATIMAILSSFFEVKEAVERLFEPEQIYTVHLLPASVIALVVHIVAVYGVENQAFAHVIQASGSSWLQEHTSDISRTVCRIVPALNRLLLPRVNPISLVGVIVASLVGMVYTVMETYNLPVNGLDFPDPLPDTIGAILISCMLFGTMMPMTLYSGRILLQTTPAHLVGPLDKALREASTIDGVLELRNEHFWSVGFGTLAGSLYVRVRRGANEQLVLAHVTDRLHSIVRHLTIQVYKDDWTRTTGSYNYNWLNNGVLLPASTQANAKSQLATTPHGTSNPSYTLTVPSLHEAAAAMTRKQTGLPDLVPFNQLTATNKVKQ